MITSTLTTVVTIIVLITGLLNLWKLWHSFDADQIRKLKQHINIVWWIASLLVGALVFGGLSLSEFLSDDPISKSSMAKAVGFSSLATIWFVMHFLFGVFYIVEIHHKIIGIAVNALDSTSTKG